MRSPVTTRVLAFAVSAIVVLVQLLALHHEGEVTHVKTALTGDYAHAHALGEAHAASTTQHLHSRDSHPHDDGAVCRLLSGLEQASIASTTPTILVALAPCATSIAVVPASAPALPATLLLFAPKTSPPAHA